jgi:hypothetical protein
MMSGCQKTIFGQNCGQKSNRVRTNGKPNLKNLISFLNHFTEFPWGTVPVLKYKDMELSQSMAIARFLARKFDLIGDNEQESAKCDEIVDALKDFTSGN